MFVFAPCIVLVLVAFLHVGMIWEGFILCFFFMLHWNLDVLYWGIFMGCAWHYSPLDREEVAMWRRALVGPQWWESPLMERGGREGRVVWAPTRQTMPYWCCENLSMGKEWSSLWKWPRKGFEKNGNSYGLTPKGLWMVWCWHLSLGKSTSPHMRSYGWI